MLRRLGQSDLFVSPIGLGLWPIAGMTSLEVNDQDSSETISTALSCGINFFDTAYCYGEDGVSERLLGLQARTRRKEMIIATKGGVHWDSELNRVNDASPARLDKELNESLRRLEIPFVDLLYLHSPDQITSIADSARAMAKAKADGRARHIGVSNVTLAELREFHSVCPVVAVQLKYNMLQRDIEKEIVPWCLDNSVSIVVYWTLMKGLLAGKLRRGHEFDPSDKRLSYPQFQGREWERNQLFLDRLDQVAAALRVPLITLVLGWTMAQPGITSILCGAKRAWQIMESAEAMKWKPTADELARIDDVIFWRDALE